MTKQAFRREVQKEERPSSSQRFVSVSIRQHCLPTRVAKERHQPDSIERAAAQPVTCARLARTAPPLKAVEARPTGSDTVDRDLL
jgi:hypothetical protein